MWQPAPEYQEATIVPVHSVIEERKITWTPQTLERLAEDTARAEGVPVYSFVETMRCESKNFIDHTIQSEWYRKDGTRERSFGVAQWNLDSNDITYEQAIDPEYALKRAAEEFARGHQKMWTCYGLVAHEPATSA